MWKWLSQWFIKSIPDSAIDEVEARKIETLLSWLADAPLFIDETLVEQFYDAVIKPEGKRGKTVIEFGKETSKVQKSGSEHELGIEGNTGEILSNISGLFPALKVTGKYKGVRGTEEIDKISKKNAIELFPIDNPHRQLVHLTIAYLSNHPQRISLIKNLSDGAWRTKDSIHLFPRQLVFLDLPSLEEANSNQSLQTKLYPMAAEFSNGKVIILFNDEKLFTVERPTTLKNLEEDDDSEPNHLMMKDHWKWVYNNFKPREAMEVIENAANSNEGKIRWIDYRLPTTMEGDTVHLHFSPGENYYTGDFGFKLVKRGAKYGLRIVGILKSGPGINVLAVFEK